MICALPLYMTADYNRGAPTVSRHLLPKRLASVGRRFFSGERRVTCPQNGEVLRIAKVRPHLRKASQLAPSRDSARSPVVTVRRSFSLLFFTSRQGQLLLLSSTRILPMSASLARTLFRPAARSTPAATKGTTTCPAARFFPASPSGTNASSSIKTSASARTLNAIAHISVAAALVASSVSRVTLSGCPVHRRNTGGLRLSRNTADFAENLHATQVSFLNHPDPLLFDHPPRSAIGFMPSRYIVAGPTAGGADRGPADRARPRRPLSEGNSTPLGDATRLTTTARTATARAFLESTSSPGMVAYTALSSLSDPDGAAATVMQLMTKR